jgi:hypothetical protein
MVETQVVWDFLRSKGLPEGSTAAIMGNMYRESGFDETLLEYGNQIGYGLCQWSFERRTQLEAYGIDVTHQLEFLWSEMTGQNRAVTGADMQWINRSAYLSLANFMSGNGSISTLTNAFCFCWERPSVAVSGIDIRFAKANEYYNQFTGREAYDAGTAAPSANDNMKNLQRFLNTIGMKDNKGQALIVDGRDGIRTQQAKANAVMFLKNLILS